MHLLGFASILFSLHCFYCSCQCLYMRLPMTLMSTLYHSDKLYAGNNFQYPVARYCSYRSPHFREMKVLECFPLRILVDSRVLYDSLCML
ncbi:hypothetical protein M758_10G057300 [Ceratodon purpureus]|uniref:Secreted protein n=1 Tax=Ceratodon purpureus TaxID=3225 RepID=A0A8T0GK15_CERPU|nr:hypothetical protein KC19_10G061200 [Ceratodon purpureus]KAG0602993.1 hypothetical protein M758_10G057300 [Ceratodon purpureus]